MTEAWLHDRGVADAARDRRRAPGDGRRRRRRGARPHRRCRGVADGAWRRPRPSVPSCSSSKTSTGRATASSTSSSRSSSRGPTCRSWSSRSTRPELLDRRPAWCGGRRNALSLALDPLPDARRRAPGRAPRRRRARGGRAAVVERADGNPSTPARSPGRSWSRWARLDPDAVRDALQRLPDTVQATVLARLDLLEPADRRMLQVGAVFGRSFLPSGVGVIEPALAESGEDIAERLLDRDLVRPASQGELAFRHILIREVAYGMLPRAERAQLHAAAAALARRRAQRVRRTPTRSSSPSMRARPRRSRRRWGSTVPARSARPRSTDSWRRRRAPMSAGGERRVDAPPACCARAGDAGSTPRAQRAPGQHDRPRRPQHRLPHDRALPGPCFRRPCRTHPAHHQRDPHLPHALAGLGGRPPERSRVDDADR